MSQLSGLRGSPLPRRSSRTPVKGPAPTPEASEGEKYRDYLLDRPDLTKRATYLQQDNYRLLFFPIYEEFKDDLTPGLRGNPGTKGKNAGDNKKRWIALRKELRTAGLVDEILDVPGLMTYVNKQASKYRTMRDKLAKSGSAALQGLKLDVHKVGCLHLNQMVVLYWYWRIKCIDCCACRLWRGPSLWTSRSKVVITGCKAAMVSPLTLFGCCGFVTCHLTYTALTDRSARDA